MVCWSILIPIVFSNLKQHFADYGFDTDLCFRRSCETLIFRIRTITARMLPMVGPVRGFTFQFSQGWRFRSSGRTLGFVLFIGRTVCLTARTAPKLSNWSIPFQSSATFMCFRLGLGVSKICTLCFPPSSHLSRYLSILSSISVTETNPPCRLRSWLKLG